MCSKHEHGDPSWALAHRTIQNGTLTTSGLLKCGNLVKCRTQVRGDPFLTSWSSILIWTLTPPQNRPFSKTTFILEHSEWPIAKDAEPFSRRCNARHWQTFSDLVKVYVFDIGSICICGTELLINNTGENFTLKQVFEISEKLIVGQSDEIYGVNTINWVDSSWTFIFDRW